MHTAPEAGHQDTKTRRTGQRSPRMKDWARAVPMGHGNSIVSPARIVEDIAAASVTRILRTIH